MGWSIGYDENWKRDIGYGVIAYCDYPGCKKEIDRGLSYVCGGDAYGGDRGCGLYFCSKHLIWHERLPQLCERCSKRRKPFEPKSDHPLWIRWKLKDDSWKQWRDENPEEVYKLNNLWNKVRNKSKYILLDNGEDHFNEDNPPI